MSLRYCFEKAYITRTLLMCSRNDLAVVDTDGCEAAVKAAYVARTLARCRKNDLAVVDTEGHEKAVKEAVKRGVYVYGYLNVGALGVPTMRTFITSGLLRMTDGRVNIGLTPRLKNGRFTV